MNKNPIVYLKRIFTPVLYFLFFLSCQKDEIKSPPQEGLVASFSLDGNALRYISIPA